MDTDQVIRTFLDFFRDRGHHRVEGSTLIPPPGDPVLFTTSGMHPLTPYLTGRPHPGGHRLVGVQRCLRTTDLDEVGDLTHLTVFQMLGSWSLGDYDGRQSVQWGFELLRDGFGLDPRRLHATVFGGDDPHHGTVRIGPDTESTRTWHELGVPVEVTRDENWWSNGPTGPCGPDSEIFVWTGEGEPEGRPSGDPRWVEVWNHVQMRYHRREDGGLEPLTHPNVDTGMGLERLLMVVQGRSSVYDTDLFQPWVRAVSRLWSLTDQSRRVVCDHLRSIVVMSGDGVRPSNTGRGYVLRRLIRRVLTTLWRDDPCRTLSDLPDEPIEHTLHHYGQVRPIDVLPGEERRFRDLIHRGRSVVRRQSSRGPLTEADLDFLRDTHGLPRDLVLSLLTETPEGSLVGDEHR